jgi:hypothetical protein
MGKSVMFRLGVVGTILHVGHRYQGCHREAGAYQGRTRFASVRETPALPSAVPGRYPNQATAPQDFYVVFPNVPASPNGIGPRA